MVIHGLTTLCFFVGSVCLFASGCGGSVDLWEYRDCSSGLTNID